MMRKTVSILCLFAFLLAGCAAPRATFAPAAQQDESTAWPTRGWQVSTPAEQGMDPALLEQMLEQKKARSLDLNSIVVIRRGVIVLEEYYGGEDADTLHAQYSVTKSFISTMVGITFDQGKLESVEQTVSEVLPGRTYQNPDPRKDAMKVEHLLTMTTGLDWKEGDPAYRAMYVSADWVKYVMDLPLVAEPGKQFNYCSGCSHVLSAIVREHAGTGVGEFGKKYLFEPLGITRYHWETNSAGVEIGGWGLNLSARDMAKLGYLFLHEGAWDGKQIVSSEWVKNATTKHVTGNDGRLDYGYQWWIDSKNPGAYAALGRGGQMIYVDPARDLIVVFTAGDESHDAELDLIDNFVLPSVR